MERAHVVNAGQSRLIQSVHLVGF